MHSATPALPDGYIDLPPGKLAAVVTCLEMREPPQRHEAAPKRALSLERVERPNLRWYRQLFRRIGEPVLWFSRLELDDDALAKIVYDAAVEVYVAREDDREIGFVELDFRSRGECELVFFGLVAEAIGTGAGGWLMREALQRAWARPIGRLWVHTCTLDQPGIVSFYRRFGFVPFKRQIEVFSDPRATGLLARDAAPDVPLL